MPIRSSRPDDAGIAAARWICRRCVDEWRQAITGRHPLPGASAVTYAYPGHRLQAHRRSKNDMGALIQGRCWRRLRTLAKAFSETTRVAPENGTKVRPGTRLVREWQGRTSCRYRNRRRLQL